MKISMFYAAALLAGVCVASHAANAAVRYVKSGAPGASDGTSWVNAFSTVTAAIAASKPNDEIWVAAGKYAGPITISMSARLYGGFSGTESKREQRDWKANRTILDGGRKGSVVWVQQFAGGTVLDGFTIQNGSGTLDQRGIYDPPGARQATAKSAVAPETTDTSTDTLIPDGVSWPPKPDRYEDVTVGGGVYVDRARAVIRNCVIQDGFADYGGGVALRGGSAPAVTQCILRGNKAKYGGAVAVVSLVYDPGYAEMPFVGDCVIESNNATTGGGIYAEGYALVASGNDIRGNSAEVGGGMTLLNGNSINNVIRDNKARDGGGIACMGSGWMASNVITNNKAEERGGGVFTQGGAQPDITNNTITGNTAPEGGAMMSTSEMGAKIVNNIIASNSSGYLDAPVFKEEPYQGRASRRPTFAGNCFFNNGGKDIEGLPDNPGVNGGIFADPRLVVSKAGIPHLGPDSPCRDAGAEILVQKGYTDWDIDGQPRVQGDAVDIGADEAGAAPTAPNRAGAWTREQA